jgi:hypothetical protein
VRSLTAREAVVSSRGFARHSLYRSLPCGPLARDVSDAHYFSMKNLIRLLTKSQAQCLHWALMKEFEIEVDGETTSE